MARVMSKQPTRAHMRYRGYEVKTEGDAFMVAFFTALECLLWCLEVQEALVGADWPEALLEQPAAKKEVCNCRKFASSPHGRTSWCAHARMHARTRGISFGGDVAQWPAHPHGDAHWGAGPTEEPNHFPHGLFWYELACFEE